MSTLPGKFVWFEHSSTDIAKARSFYEPLFNWHTESMPLGAQRHHVIFNGSQRIGGYRRAADHERAQWIAYLSVPDVDAAFAAALAAGAHAIERPMDRGSAGRAARIADPSGALLALWTGHGDDRPDSAVTADGDWYWNELWTADTIGALAFYQRLAGYSHESMDLGAQGTYYIFKTDSVSRAGMMRSADLRAPSMWLPYVAVADCDLTARQARALGGEVLTAPRDIPGVGRFAVLADTLGAAIAVIRPAPESNAMAEAVVSEATAA
ncbi:MAG TPA: VOC family protein [Albitalea sp.]|nr:VOC family protein [Albitalea sp.]